MGGAAAAPAGSPASPAASERAGLLAAGGRHGDAGRGSALAARKSLGGADALRLSSRSLQALDVGDLRAPPVDSPLAARRVPCVALVNCQSGELLGRSVHAALADLLGPKQVFDLQNETEPGARIAELVAVASSGRGVRVVVAGGDGSAAWVLGALADAGLDPSITPVAILPLGTGNDMARATGWLGFGGLISRAPLKQRLLARLHAIACAPIVRLDRWRVSLRLKAGGPGAGAAAAALAGGGLPPAFSCEHNAPEATGRFFNYLSIGMDAQIAYGFHQSRRASVRSKLGSRRRMSNKLLYVLTAFWQGWACGLTRGCCGQKASLCGRVVLRVRGGRDAGTPDDECERDPNSWRYIRLPEGTTGVVILNVNSFAGGRDLWRQRWGWSAGGAAHGEGSGSPPGCSDHMSMADGLVEVVALRGGAHLAGVMTHLSGATRLAQVSEVRLEVLPHAGGARGPLDRAMAMQIDGEPWLQRLDSGPVVLEVGHGGESAVLSGPNAVC